MRRLLTLAALAAGAPTAHAIHALYDCGYDTMAGPQPQSGPQTYDGVAYGYVGSPVPGEDVSIRCYVEVDGVEVASASVGETGTTAAVARGTIKFAASPDQNVELCGEMTAGDERRTFCFVSVPVGFPPQEVCDFVEDATLGHVTMDRCHIM